jgi:hypothetical protein
VILVMEVPSPYEMWTLSTLTMLVDAVHFVILAR